MVAEWQVASLAPCHSPLATRYPNSRLLRSQRDRGIHPRRPPRWEPAGEHRYTGEKHDDTDIRDRIEARDAEEQRHDRASRGHRAAEANGDAEKRQRHPLPHDETENVAARRA